MLEQMARLEELMQRTVVSVAPEDTIGETAEKMVAAAVGSAVVVDGGRLIGILTERDLMRAVAGRVHASEARVREWMTAEPITVDASAQASEAARIMLEHGFRHLPVVAGDRTVGIVSIRDVTRWSMHVGPESEQLGPDFP